MTPEERLAAVLALISKHGQTGTYSGKAWAIDQIVQILTGDQYAEFVDKWEKAQAQLDPWQEKVYWDAGIKPRD